MATAKIRTDNEFNITFCKLMKNYPALYDYTCADYSNRDFQEAQWQELAVKLDATAQDCRERWKNIRNRYVKYKKAQDTGSKMIKEYYLARHLGYLDKFLRTRKKRIMVKSKRTEDCSESEVEETSNPQSPSLSPPPSPEESKVNLQSPSDSTINENKTSYECYFESKPQSDDEPKDLFDPDWAFLQSVLPDMKSMRADQKRKFKIGVITLAGRILDDNPLDPMSYNFNAQ